MNIIEKAVLLFGMSPEDVTVSKLLDEAQIIERPEFDDDTVVTLSKPDLGFSFKFEVKAIHEETYGFAQGSGEMVLTQIRVYGPFNTEKYASYNGKLPLGLAFSQEINEMQGILGKPDVEEAPGTPRRTMIWNNAKGYQVGMVLTKDEKHIRYLDIWRVRTA